MGLGDGYVAFVDSLLAALHPEVNIKVLNTGINGHRITDLEARWQRDVLDLAPDWLSVMIGINDVWQQFGNQLEPDQIKIEQYENIYRKLLKQIRHDLKGLILMSPYFIEPDPSNLMRKHMDAYSRVVEKLAHEFDALFVDTQAAFDRYLAHRSPQSLSDDRIHPNKTGHMIIANAFLESIEFSV
jgi:lysophospholipase L1-like esterase